MAEGLNFKWFYCEGDLPDILTGIGWDGCGFSRAGVAWSVANSYQLNNKDGVMVSLFPIEDEASFSQTIGAYIAQLDQLRSRTKPSTLAPWQRFPDGRMRVITQEECDTIHAQLLALEEQRQAEITNVPTEEDVYRAEQLLLLTEICNGVAALQSESGTVE